MTALLDVHGLTAGYGATRVLSDLHLLVDPGEIVALLGVNGAGKTTTLRVLSGLADVTAGTVRYDGDDITSWTPHARVRAGLIHVPESRHLFPSLSVAENLRMGGHRFKGQKDRVHRAMEQAYEMFPRLRERAGQAAGTLSGGEQQMVAIARGLASDPRLLLIDEASFGLAPKVAGQVFEAIHRIRESGIAMLLVEQNVQRALEVVDRAYVVEKGTVVYSGSAADLQRESQLATSLLGGSRLSGTEEGGDG